MKIYIRTLASLAAITLFITLGTAATFYQQFQNLINFYFNVIFAILICLLLLLYGYYPLYQLHRSGFAYPTSAVPFLGNVWSIYHHGLHKQHCKWRDQFGHLYALALGRNITVSIADPDLLKDVLVKHFASFVNRRPLPIPTRFRDSIFTSPDEYWRWSRQLIVPTFTSHKIRIHMFPLMAKCAGYMYNYVRSNEKNSLSWSPSNESNSNVVVLDMKALYGYYTMDVIASTAFGVDINSHLEEDNLFVRNAKKAFDVEVIHPAMALAGIFPFLEKIFTWFDYSFVDENSLQFFADVVAQAIEQRKRTGYKRRDYLQLLIDANEVYKGLSTNSENPESPKAHTCTQKNTNSLPNIDENLMMEVENIANSHKTESNICTNSNNHCPLKLVNEESQLTKTRKGLTDQEVICNAILFFIAGYESTANAMGYLTHVLAWHPEVQERVRQEIMEVPSYQKDDVQFQDITCLPPNTLYGLNYDDILGLTYMDQVIKETLRIYPPIVIFDRVASKNYILTDKSGQTFTIQKGMAIEIPIYSMHRDPELWGENANVFDPERWTDKESISKYQYQYMPFGYGPRNCIGLRFALLEIKIGITTLLGAGIRVVPPPGGIRDLTPDNVEFKKNGLNVPKAGIKVGFLLPNQEEQAAHIS